jgi:hypothetical protein
MGSAHWQKNQNKNMDIQEPSESQTEHTIQFGVQIQ